MTTDSPFDPHAQLDAFHDAISKLTKEATEADLDAVVKFFAPTGAWYLRGMNSLPLEDRAAAKEAFRGLIKYWRLVDRVVTTKAVTEDGTTAIAEMDNNLEILDEPLQFREIEVAEFDVGSGLMVSFRLYADGKPIQEILKRRGYR